MVTRSTRAALRAVALTGTLLLAACGSDSSSTGSTPATAAPSTASPSTAASPATSAPSTAAPETAAPATTAPPAAGADTEAAKALVAGYTGKPSKFPIDTPLVTKPTGKRIAYLDCGTPICGLFYTLAQPPMEALGMTLTSIKSGLAPDTVQAAFDTVIQDKYDGVFVPAIPLALWNKGLSQLSAAKIPVVTSGVIGADPTAIPVQQVGTKSIQRTGELLAAQVVAEHGDQANVVFYYTPELDFTGLLKDAFVSEMGTLCADCKVRVEKVGVGTFGTTAPNVIVDDLQANPDTKTAVFGIGEQTPGLAAAMKTATLSIESIVNSPGPAELEGIQKGDLNLGLGLDLPVIAWTVADSLARLTTGQPPAPGAVDDIAPQQFLTAADLTGDVSQGWAAYPDFPQRFQGLWAGAK
jgi:ribose transport system substrate-binding protein